MIRLVFTLNREVFKVEIEDKEIWYSDRKWKRAVKLVPTDEHFIKKIKMSRNKIPHHFIDFFKLTKEEQKEYDNASNDIELADICVMDVRKKGAKLLKYEN